MQTDRELKILLTKSLKDPYYVFGNNDCRTTAFCSLFIEQCSDTIFDTPGVALELAFIVRRLAQDTRDQHLIAKAAAMVGSGYRVEGVYEKASECLLLAEHLASGCPCCLAEILRRRGVNLFHQNRPSDMYRVLTEAMAYYEACGDTDGVGRVLIHRGTGLWLEGRTTEALRDERNGLELFNKDKTPSRYYLAGMVNITAFLADPKDNQGKSLKRRRSEEAMQYLATVREQLKGSKRRHEVVRVVLRWIEGLICATRGERKKAFRLLISARNGIKRLGLRTEYIAVSADLAKLYKANTPRRNDDQVIKIAAECLEDVRTTDEEKELLQQLRFDPQIATIEKLREATACRVPTLL